MKLSLKRYIYAGNPLIVCQTHEVERAIKEFTTEIQDTRTVYRWDCQRGILLIDGLSFNKVSPKELPAYIAERLGGDTIVLAENYLSFLRDPMITQEVYNCAMHEYRSTGKTLLSIGPDATIPGLLEKITVLVDFDYPNAAAIKEFIETFIENQSQEELLESDNLDVIIEAASGLTLFELENGLSISASLGKISREIISELKVQTVKKSGYLEIWEPKPLSVLGGLNKLKEYWGNRAAVFRDASKPPLKGVLILGVSGTGKSLAAKVAASIFQLPLFRLDIGSLKTSLVGSSEQRIRAATKVMDAAAPAIVWADEVEKMWAGVSSSGQVDAGTTAGMFSHYLTWMQESQSQLYHVMTANSLKNLPPEFLRAGRLDAIWFVDLPNSQEVAEIVNIMNDRYKADIPTSWASKLRGFTGAEIEQLARDSVFDGLEDAYQNLIPLERTMKEEIDNMRTWAQTRARLASGPEKLSTARKIKKEGVN